MPALRILHVVPYYEQAWAYGGIPRVATAVARGLARRRHAVTVCTTDACDDRRRARLHPADPAPDRPNVRIFRNLSNSLAYTWQLFLPLGLTRALRAATGTFDIAHLHACRNLPVVRAARLLRRAGVPYVVSPNGTAPLLERRFIAKRIFDATAGRGYLEGAAAILAVSDAERRQLIEMGVAADRIAVVPNPIDESEFQPPPDGQRFRAAQGLGAGPIVLLLGKLTPRKGTGVLIEAFSRLAHPSARLVIAGNDMGAGIAALIERSACGPRTTRVGLLRGRARLDALAAADVVVYPSRDEVFGLVPVEALLAGTPVVVSSDSGAGEIIGGIGGGHVVPYGDAQALAGAIDAILRDPARWRRRARVAAARARVRFGADVVCERLDSVYRTLLGQPHASSWL
jgi:glycosyltransferase involved in cell wall biosynthesis